MMLQWETNTETDPSPLLNKSEPKLHFHAQTDSAMYL